MKNFQITSVEDNKKYWISRSCGVGGVIYYPYEESYKILIVKRGKGSEDYPGLWCLPSGYIDFDETAEQALVREIEEETNYIVDQEFFELFHINSSPTANRQNITIYYKMESLYEPKKSDKIVNGGEEDEIEEVRWIDFDEINDYEFAFDGNKIIEKAFI
jgi:8-oxo-dGTP pyrophosphatase MutT (NUDIX family)